MDETRGPAFIAFHTLQQILQTLQIATDFENIPFDSFYYVQLKLTYISCSPSLQKTFHGTVATNSMQLWQPIPCNHGN
jgi:hypothetical protein